ncbi:MAG: adenylate/guanylate cyclase domain-containing protein [Spirulinaceae cyanobacterium]
MEFSQPQNNKRPPLKKKQNRPTATTQQRIFIAIWRWLNLTRLSYLFVCWWSISGAIATGLDFPVVQQIEKQAQVFFFKLRGPLEPPNEIVILDIDQSSLDQGKFYQAEPELYPELEPLQAWPWKRTAYAEAITKVMEAGAKAVAVDVILDLPSSYGQEDDLNLQQVLQEYGDRIILAAHYEENEGQGVAQRTLSKPDAIFQTTPDNLGLINYWYEADGRVHRLATEYNEQVLAPWGLGEGILSFAEATLQAANIEFEQPQGQYIDYYGPPNTFNHVPFWNVLYSRNWQFHSSNQTFKDKIVLIGATAPTLEDFKRTPFTENMPGIEVHANAITTLMTGSVIAEALPSPRAKGLLVLLGVAGTGVLLVKSLKKPVLTLAGALAGAIVWGGISYLCFTYASLILPTAVPTVALTLTGVSCLAVGALKAQIERLRLYQTLGRYVAAPIVNEILTHHSDDFRELLKGKKIKAAILFSDIRSFTTMSLKLEPEELVEKLNTYLNAMVEAILAEGGTLDKFIGDAVMAEFGSPISRGAKEDAMNAVRAALKMREALAELHKRWEAEGEELFFNGIGINYGEVIAGDIGSSTRREYAVIGDTVNVASRVEGLTGKLWVDILITDSLYELVKEEVQVIPMGEHQLKGRGKNKVKLYSLVGMKDDDISLYLHFRDELRHRFGYQQRSSS